MILFEIVVLGCFAFFCICIPVVLLCLAFQDTDTFLAVDEKIARLIRGNEEE